MTSSNPLPTSPSKLKVGCVGGGQLGRMMALEAPRLNIDMKFLDGTGGLCPSAQVVGVTSGNGDNSGGTTRIVKGQLYDESALRELSQDCNVVTMEIEHVGVDGLAKLESEGVNVQPSSRVIGIIQDKFVQKVCIVSVCDVIWDFGYMCSTYFAHIMCPFCYRNTLQNTTFLYHPTLIYQTLKQFIQPPKHSVYH